MIADAVIVASFTIVIVASVASAFVAVAVAVVIWPLILPLLKNKCYKMSVQIVQNSD